MSWRVCKISDVFEVARGGSPRPIQAYLTDSPEGLNWIMIGDASEGSKYITTTKKRIKLEGLRKTRMVREGDFLLTNSMSFGRPYILKTSGCIHDGWLVLSPKGEAISPDFGYYLLGSATLYREFSKRAAGAVVKNLNTSLVREVRIPLPPLAEQKRIATILDAADALRAKRRESLAQLDTLLQSTFLDMFGDPVTNPMGYPVRELGELMKDADVFTDGDWVESKDQDPNGNVRLTQLADVGDGKWIDKSARYLTSEKASQLRCTYLAVGDVVVARMPDPLGRAAIFPGDPMPCVTVVDVCILRPNHGAILPSYLVGAINSPRVRHDIKGRATGTTRKRISRGNLRKVMLVAPPLGAQRSFADIAESVEKQKATQRAHLDELDTLFASLQSRAFRGDL